MIRLYKTPLIAIALYALSAAGVSAQDAATASEENAPVIEEVAAVPQDPAPVAAVPESLQKVAFNPNDYDSMVFTEWEYAAIQDALRSRGSYRPPTDDEIARNLKNDPNAQKVKPPPEEREIRLSGILYNSGADWTVWLNEERITPDAIPEEVMDLKVYKSYIEFKWFDDYTNKIYPIRLRPHQRFNIDTRIFLPG